MPFVLLFVSIFLAVVGQLLLKKGMWTVGIVYFHFSHLWSTFLKVFSNWYVIFGFVFFVLSALLWLAVLSRLDISKAYPMVAAGYILVLLASRWGIIVTREPVSPIRWIGALVICFGVYLISRTDFAQLIKDLSTLIFWRKHG
ncbi:4-amino-4-deoxy-L-arabinose-phosphoundecaprenol flippase subunit ArnE [subsurface metagenome]